MNPRDFAFVERAAAVAQSRPTILQIIPRLDTGGAERAVVEIAAAVVCAGGRALVLAEPGGRLAPEVAAAGGEVVPFPAASKNPLGMLANARAIERLIARECIDLVHARSRAPAWSALAAARRARVPFVTTYHGAYGETNAVKRFYNGVMARGDVVIANSRYTADLIAQRYGTPRDRVEVIHRGVDCRRFDPAQIAPERVAALRACWGVDPAARVILQAARLTAWKGQSVVIDAAAGLKAAGHLDNALVVLAGDSQGRDTYLRSLQDQVAQAGLESQIRVVGHVEDIAAAYLAAHVTVVASTEPEAFGRAAIEAAAMGSPVIATAIGAPPEIVLAEPAVGKDAATGWLVPPGDAAALGERLAAALALAPAERSAMAGRAREHVLAQFTVEAMQRRTLAVYDRLLGTLLERRFAEAGPTDATAIPQQS
jgi:glycosyltransferase involved in cell wall biosynthesis